eukprot:8780717-Lingulodinium_polyedra.AAC.1
MEERRVADFKGNAGNAELYCEHRSLSVERVGQPYWSASYGDIPTLTNGDLSDILGTCALFRDLDSHAPTGEKRAGMARAQG